MSDGIIKKKLKITLKSTEQLSDGLALSLIVDGHPRPPGPALIRVRLPVHPTHLPSEESPPTATSLTQSPAPLAAVARKLGAP